MNRSKPSSFGVGFSFLAILAAFLIMGWLLHVTRDSTQPRTLGNQRGLERKKILTDLRKAEVDLIQNYGWHDQARSLVRLPVDQAMQLMVQEWKNPSVGRSNLILRAEKAVPPTNAPAAPPKNPYE